MPSRAAEAPLRRTGPSLPGGPRAAALSAALVLALALSIGPPALDAKAERNAPADGPVTGAERGELLEILRSRQAKVRSFRAVLTRKRKSPLLAEEAVTEGVFLFEKPDRFRWESRRPDRRLLVSDGKVLTLYFPERKEAERRDARDQFSTRMALEFMASGMERPISEQEKRYRIDLARRGGMLVLTLSPLSGFLARAVKTITVEQPAEGSVPTRIVVLGTKGDRTETSLRDVEINPTLSADAFLVKLGPQVKVFDPADRKARGEDSP